MITRVSLTKGPPHAAQIRLPWQELIFPGSTQWDATSSGFQKSQAISATRAQKYSDPC